jgi:predicted ATPase/DNA-binding winged helix-turn-helix (wHTH) protein
VPLGRIAIDLLGALVRAHGRLVSKEELFDAAWPDVVVVENALHQHMRALRQALGDQAELIVTVARAGYRFTGNCQEVGIEDAGAGETEEAPPLPATLAPLIGREDELQAIESLLGERRCVTLLGPGGAGKTRLALEVARRWADRTASKAHWVELAATADADSVAGAVAAAFGLAGPSSVPPLARVRHALREAPALLVLDNCEHLVAACTAAMHELLQAAPGLKILATSQRPLGVAGAHRLRLAMLGLPPPGTVDPELLAAAPAVRLLMARLRDCSSQLTFDDEDLRSAAELCRKLDGNALAIELAAARVASLGLAATHSALAGRFDLLAAGPRDVLPKHRSLDAMIDWSHALLSAEQALVFRRLGVFAGGWTMESAIALLDSVGLHDLTEVASRLSSRSSRPTANTSAARPSTQRTLRRCSRPAISPGTARRMPPGSPATGPSATICVRRSGSRRQRPTRPSWHAWSARRSGSGAQSARCTNCGSCCSTPCCKRPRRRPARPG